MAYYVRKIARAKWKLLDEVSDDIIENYGSDTVANDMRTQSNTLSLWRIDSLSEEDTEQAAVINSLLGDTISKIELLFIPEDLITGFSLENQEGNTAVSCCRNMHVNVTGLTVKRHISFARDIVLKLLLNEQIHRKEDGYQHFIKRYSEQKQLELIDKWIEQGKISFEDLRQHRTTA